jgi:ribose transport system ATP-binding protein
LLQTRNIDKHYDGVHALRGVDFSVKRGEVHALIGENGAGKSTLGKIIAGVVRADGGEIWLDEKRVHIESPLDAQKLGIGIIFQELDLFPHLSVGENIVIRNLKTRESPVVSFAQIDRFCEPFLRQVGLDVPVDVPLRDLSIGQMQLVAIARALSMDARLIVMDEPTSALADDAVENLFRLIRDLRAKGVSIVYVSHKMKEILRIADRITVMRDGAVVGTKRANETNIDEIITMMVGRELKAHQQAKRMPGERIILSVRNLTTAKLHGVSFDLQEGEVLGVAGLVGAGRSELGHALFGLDRIVNGEILIHGGAIAPRLRSPRDALNLGLCLLPEDRKLQGLAMQATVRENSSLSVLSRFSRAGFLRTRAELSSIKSVHTRTRLKSSSYDAPVSALSGGNQQKVLLAKSLLTDPDVLFLDDPTRGVDVGAKQDIYDLIDELASRGKGVIFVSSELPELLRCCNRIMVLHEGRVSGILDAREATQEKIMSLAV